MVEAIRPVSEIHVPQVHTGGAGSGVPPYLGGEGGVSGVPGSGMAALEQGPVESQGTFNYDLLNQGTFASQAPQRPESMGSQSSVDFNKLPNISMSYTGYLMAMRNLPPTPGQKFAREGVELLAKKAGISAFQNFGGPQLVNAIVPGAFYTSFNPFSSAGGAALRNLVGTKTATGTLMPKGLGAFGNPLSGSKLVPTKLSKTLGSAAFYAQVGYDIFKFVDEPSVATGGALVGGAIGYAFGGYFGYAVGSFLGSTVGGLFGGGSKRYRRERLQFSMDSTAHGKSAFNAQRTQTAVGGDNTNVVAVIEDNAYYHQHDQRYSQPITLPITTGNPQGFLDLEHRSAQELVRGLIGQAIDSGTGLGSAGTFLSNTQTASLGARTIDMFLRKMGKTDKADEFRALVLDGGHNEGHFYDRSGPPSILDRDFNFLGEDTLKSSYNTGASIQVFDNRFGITQDVIYGKAVAGRSKIQRRSETFPSPRTSQLRMFGRRAIYG